MVKHTQTIRRFSPTNYLSVFDHFVGLAFKGLILHFTNIEEAGNAIYAVQGPCHTICG